MKLAAIVITYFPEINDAVYNIEQYIHHVDKLLIWENTPISDRDNYRIVLGHENKVVYLGSSKNEGIAFALNRGIEWCVQNGYTHLLTMDQDSYWQDFSRYREKAESLFDEKKCNMIITPNVNNIYEYHLDYAVIPYGITSGSIYDISIFKEIGLFREDYFIDALDVEFCFRARKRGIDTIVLVKCELIQCFGCISQSELFGFKSFNYSAFRTFFLVRNHIWLWREFPELLSFKYKKYILKEYIFGRIFKILLMEKSKRVKIISVLRGVYAGFSNKRNINL